MDEEKEGSAKKVRMQDQGLSLVVDQSPGFVKSKETKTREKGKKKAGENEEKKEKKKREKEDERPEDEQIVDAEVDGLENGHSQAEDAEDSDSNSSEIPQHESLAKKKGKKASKKLKFVPQDETKEQRDARTVFIGNLPAEIVTSRVSQIAISLFEK